MKPGLKQRFLSAWDENILAQRMPMDAQKTAISVMPVSVQETGPGVSFRESLLVALSAGLGYGFDAYAVNIYGLVIPILAVSLHLSLTTLGNISSLQLVGYTIGTIGFGWAADRWGRKDTLGVSILSYGVTTALNGIFTALVPFSAMRFLTGVGGAGELAVGAPYTAEVWPKRHRALGTGGIIFALYSLGYIVAAMVALLIVPVFGWQWAFYLALVPSVAVFLFRRKITESPRYLHAIQVAKKRQAAKNGGETASGERSIQHIWSTRESRKRVVVGSLIYIANAVGYWAIAVFLTTFVEKSFHQTAEAAIFWAIMFYIVQFFLSFAGPMLSDRIWRRPAAVIGSVIMMTAIVIAAEARAFWLFLVFMGLAVGMLGWLWGIGNTYVSELFPTHLRGTGFGWCVGVGRTASVFAPALVANGIASFGVRIPLMMIAVVWAIGIVGYLFGPETAKKELEEISA